MAVAQYDISIAKDRATVRGLAGQVAKVTDAVTNIPIEEIQDLFGNPIQALISDADGYFPAFQIVDGPPLVRLAVGSVAYNLVDQTLTGEAAEDAKAAAAKSIATATVQGDDLVITRENGEVINAGNVRGGPDVPGTAGPSGSGFVSNVAVDEDGRPYFAAGSNEVQLISDTDGRPYYHVI